MKRRAFSQYDGKKQKWLHDTIEICMIFAVIFVLFRFIIGISFVSGNSMFPSLQNGEVAFYTRIIPRFEQGDVLSIRMPSGEYYVKRVIAVGGDVIDIHDGKVYVNDVLLDEPYVNGETLTKEGGVTYPYHVEEGKVFVMGDNRGGSMDSRDFGAVIRKQIKGKLWLHIGIL